jgi:NTP pyrophosphatase (non-canonical NTP hydrolase)
MKMDDYQSVARTTAVYPKECKLVYPTMGLAGEAGELCNKVKKLMRGDPDPDPGASRDARLEELGDCLWYVANAAADMGALLSDVARRNVTKLEGRRRRGTLKGEGDKR